MTRRVDYTEYLKSPEWRAKRQWALERAGNRCQVCNGKDRLEVHHRTYENLGAELPADLTVLCDGCHERHHHVLPATPREPPDPIETMKRIADARDRLLASR